MTTLFKLQQFQSSVFRDDEPVIAGRPLLPGACVPVFGQVNVWDFNGVLERPANVHASSWKVLFSGPLEDPYWNLIAREAFMAIMRPTHPAVVRAGVALPIAAHLRTVTAIASRLRVAADWAVKNGLSQHPDAWTQDDLRRRIRLLGESETAESTVRGHVAAMKLMADVGPLLTLAWPAGDPWPGQSARAVAMTAKRSGPRAADELSTPVVPPQVWFPLVRAAWAYLHDFAPDILRADQRLQDLQAAAGSSVGIEERLRAWLADPDHNVPIHAPAEPGEPPVVNWSMLALLIGCEERFRTRIHGDRGFPGGVRCRAMVDAAVAAGRVTTNVLATGLYEVTRPDGSTGPWHPGIDPRALMVLKAALRNAAFSLLAALTMMRDSEIHEIPRGCVVEHYSTPAIASTKIKGTSDRAGKRWWIADPVAEALGVAEAISVHPDRVFSPVKANIQDGTLVGAGMLAKFVETANAGRAWSGLDEIPETYIRPHMFRRTMAMLTDQFPGSEIATGIQLKHLATRALANAATRGYAAPDDSWAEHLETALGNVKFRQIKDLYQQHTAGQEIGFGGGADQLKAAFDDIAATVRARNGDERTADTLLRAAHIHIRFGVLNHCTADHTNPVGAACLENAIIPEGHVGPLHERCRPDRCGNSLIGPEHLPIYDSHARRQLQIIDDPRTPVVRREAAERELEITNNVLAVASGRRP